MTSSHELSLTTTPVVRISSARDVVATIPPQLGFFPSDSVVLVCLQGPRNRVGPLVRLDLPYAATASGVDAVVSAAERYADAALVVCYHDGPRPSCLDRIQRALRRHRVPLMSTVSVSAGLIRDATTSALFRRDPGVPQLPDDDELSTFVTSTYALAGRSLLPDRHALEASVRPPDTGPSPSWSRAMRQARADLAEHSPRPTAQQLLDLWSTARDECGATGRVSEPLAAAIVVRLDDHHWRDRLVARAVAENDVTAVATLTAIARQCPDQDASEVCSALACAAYRMGDGALAHCALDRADIAAPQHRLSGLLRAIVQAGLPPSSLEAMADIDQLD